MMETERERRGVRVKERNMTQSCKRETVRLRDSKTETERQRNRESETAKQRESETAKQRE